MFVSHVQQVMFYEKAFDQNLVRETMNAYYANPLFSFSDSKYETSLTCIQEFVSGCPRDVQQAVSEVINTKSLRRAMQKLCDSIHGTFPFLTLSTKSLRRAMQKLCDSIHGTFPFLTLYTKSLRRAMQKLCDSIHGTFLFLTLYTKSLRRATQKLYDSIQGTFLFLTLYRKSLR